MAKYLLTRKAVSDISSIWNYTAEKWSERQADLYYEMLIATFRKIAGNPAIGKEYNDIDSSILGHGVGRHIVFYRLQGKAVEIIRILHQRMDLKSRFKE